MTRRKRTATVSLPDSFLPVRKPAWDDPTIAAFVDATRTLSWEGFLTALTAEVAAEWDMSPEEAADVVAEALKAEHDGVSASEDAPERHGMFSWPNDAKGE